MIGKLIPLFLVVLGLAAGVGGGLLLRPAEEQTGADAIPAELLPATTEFVKLNNQFVIPVVEKGRVASLVIMSLSLEVKIGVTETVFEREPKIRDVLLQILFDHANAGGFKGVFTDGANLILLRQALLEAAKTVLGSDVTDILISDLARQDS
jgi:hypothetical protein